MRTLLEFFLRYCDFLYLDPRYRITDSSTTGVPNNNASLNLTGPILSWGFANDRGQILLTVAPTELPTFGNWFRIPLIKQYLNGDEEIEYSSAENDVEWARENSGRIGQLFSDHSAIETTCESLRTLRQSNTEKYITRWRKQQGLTQ